MRGIDARNYARDMGALEIAASAPLRPPLSAVFEGVAKQRENGAAAVWWADHLLHWFPQSIWTPDLVPAAATQPSPHTWCDPFTLVAAAAQHVPDIRFGIGVTDTIRRHPANLAQTALTLDHATQGRFILGIGVGEALNLSPIGTHNHPPLSRLREALEAMRLLFSTTDEVDYDGEHVTLRGAAVGLQPYGEAPPPLWVAAHAPRGLRVVGELADGWFPVCTRPDDYTRMWTVVQDAARAAGREGAVTPALYSRVVVAETDEEAIAAAGSSTLLRFISITAPEAAYLRHDAEHPLGAGSNGITHFVPTGLSRDEALGLANRVPAEVVCDTVIAGSPDTVATRLAEMAAAGARHIQVVNMTPLASPDLAGPSIARIGETLTELRRRTADLT